MSADEEAQREQLASEIDGFLQSLAARGDTYFRGLVVGWSLYVDRLDPDDPPSSQGWYSILEKPGQRPITTLGQFEAGRVRLSGGYIAHALHDALEDDDDE